MADVRNDERGQGAVAKTLGLGRFPRIEKVVSIGSGKREKIILEPDQIKSIMKDIEKDSKIRDEIDKYINNSLKYKERKFDSSKLTKEISLIISKYSKYNVSFTWDIIEIIFSAEEISV